MSVVSGTESGTNYCWLGPLNLHTMNYEDTECIWCGPNKLASKPGRWVSIGDGFDAWSVEPVIEP